VFTQLNTQKDYNVRDRMEGDWELLFFRHVSEVRGSDSVAAGAVGSPSVGLAGWSRLMAVWMLLNEAGGAHCCRTPMALQN